MRSRNLLTFREQKLAGPTFQSSSATHVGLESELEADRPKFDVVVLDAFSSDSIPAHLLTCEAFQVYFAHLADDGTIAAHVSNQSLNLSAIVERIAAQFGVELLLMGSEAYPRRGVAQSKLVVLTSNPELKDSLRRHQINPQVPPQEHIPLWTDDHHSLWPILKWRRR